MKIYNVIVISCYDGVLFCLASIDVPVYMVV